MTTPNTTPPQTEPPAAAVALPGTKELLAAGSALGQPRVPPEPFAPFTLVPTGYELRELPRQQLAPLPDHIRQHVRLDDADSFIAYVKAFRNFTTRLFASAADLAAVRPGNAGGARFLALLDYHEGGKEGRANRIAHVAEYPVKLSLEFSLWLSTSGEGLSQMDFVRFIEQNAPDVVAPDSATLMEMALNFEARSNVTFQSKVDRVTGGRNLLYKEDVENGSQIAGAIKVPDELKLRLPVFEGGRAYDFTARLEYRSMGGKLTITYHLLRPQNVFRQALADLTDEISHELDDAEILTGAPKLEERSIQGVL